MKIGILGTGVVGQTMAEKLHSLKNEVMIGTRDKQAILNKKGKDNFGRPPFSEWIRDNSEILLGDYSETAAFGYILINAVNGLGTLEALEQAGSNNLLRKVLIDISNPLDFSKGMPPTLFVSNTDSLGEQIQRKYPDLKVVKAFNTMNAYIMVNPGLLHGDHNLFFCGNDGDAKAEVKTFVQKFGWKEKNIIDMGDITASRGIEQILPIWVRLMETLKTPFFNFHIVVGEQKL